MEKAKGIIKTLENEIYGAIWYAAFYERVAIERNADDVCQAFGNSDEAWGITICQNALLDALILALSRIIWGTRDNTASLEALCNILEKWEVAQHLEANDQTNVKKLVNAVKNEILGNHQCASLKTYRNTQIAHLTANRGLKKNNGQRKVEYGDPLDILKKLISKVEAFLNLLNDSSSDFAFSNEESIKKADKFWKYAAHIK